MSMKGRIFQWLALTALSGAAVTIIWSTFTRRESGPSIVLIVVDTLRADKLGCYGSRSPASVEFDQLAAQGVVFENVISQASWTRSSVASMLAGRYPLKTGVRKEKWDPLPLAANTLAERLHARGFRTIGLTANPQLNRDFQFEQGFDLYSESTVIFPWMKTSDGKSRADKDSPIRSGEEMFTEASRLVRENAAYGPLYLQVLIMDVHAHHRIKPDEIDSDLATLPDPEYLQAVRRGTRPLAQFIKDIDASLDGNVIFFVVADHGEGLKDHPSVAQSRGHGNLLYRTQVHVPLVVIEGSTSNRFTPGKRPQLTQLVDLVPTVMEITGAELTFNSGDGRSLVPILKNPQAPSLHKFAFSETIWRPGVRKSAVISPDWFYIRSKDSWQGTGEEELHPFGGRQDGVQDSVISSQPDVSRLLSKELDSFFSRVSQ
jgi:arylsulfatase A-like enzyme